MLPGWFYLIKPAKALFWIFTWLVESSRAENDEKSRGTPYWIQLTYFINLLDFKNDIILLSKVSQTGSLWTGSQVGYKAKTKIELRSARTARQFFFSPYTPLGSLFTGYQCKRVTIQCLVVECNSCCPSLSFIRCIYRVWWQLWSSIQLKSSKQHWVLNVAE